MNYHQALETMGKDFDPFLHIEKEHIVDEYDNFLVILARAPYIEEHLLVIPKRKVYILSKLSPHEQSELFSILEERTEKLHQQHNSVNLLLRDWLVGWNSGKSINHLHFHLIPDTEIWSEKCFIENDRPFYESQEYRQRTENMKKKYC